jgi:hypothetical protein
MYKVNKENNNVIKIEPKLFSELHIRERENLQEWIANNPDMLGEELLIIQKEFDGFNDTQERLDLLAVDKERRLVIIENKLDDTGRNVVWQALKYTSYCSTLTTSQIINIFQKYLDQTNNSSNAKENLIEFLELENDEELLLNDKDQRIIFVANNFRKEVTSTVLWLLDHDIEIQCFRATPYGLENEIFLQIEQIIPLPETQEFMIDAKEKEKEDRTKSKFVADGEKLLQEFWSKIRQELELNNIQFLSNVTPKPEYSYGFWKGHGKFAMCISRSTIRVELYFSNDQDKKFIDTMINYKEEIENKFNGEIIWQRLENKKASRIKHEIEIIKLDENEGGFRTKANWDIWINWYKEKLSEFYNVVNPIWQKAQKEL